MLYLGTITLQESQKVIIQIPLNGCFAKKASPLSVFHFYNVNSGLGDIRFAGRNAMNLIPFYVNTAAVEYQSYTAKTYLSVLPLIYLE